MPKLVTCATTKINTVVGYHVVLATLLFKDTSCLQDKECSIHTASRLGLSASVRMLVKCGNDVSVTHKVCELLY